MPRTKGAKQKILDFELQHANELRLFIKQNNINLNQLRKYLLIRNSIIYNFMAEKTNLETWLWDIEIILKKYYNYEIPTTNLHN
jgi:hypothetical protein